MSGSFPKGVEISGRMTPDDRSILTYEAMEFVSRLQREFNGRRKDLLKRRVDRQKEINAGQLPDFLAGTAAMRADPNWKVAPTPADLQKRTVEIVGPTERKMMINALNSGADVFMADFEDTNSPTWQNMVRGQFNLRDAVLGTITFIGPDFKFYSLNKRVAVLMVRPRGWHLVEKHVLVDGEAISSSLFDFGLFFFHNAHQLLNKGSSPYFYLPKLESRLEARLWNDVFNLAQDQLGIPRGTIRATVLIETILAAFEMEEILFELRHHSAGLNAGRWDYIFSIIKKFHNQPGFLFPDRDQITMMVPFMRAYTELLVKTCHRRGAHAMGGMSAYIPDWENPESLEQALEKVREDKRRESRDGFDGTWVAHPGLVPVARQAFKELLGDKPHQKDRLREDVDVEAAGLTSFTIPGGAITDSGLRQNISLSLQYLEAWLRGAGAVAIFNLMEDTATAEISRALIWQWVHSSAARLQDGHRVNLDLYNSLVHEELGKIKNLYGEELFNSGKFELAKSLLDRLVSDEQFVDFLTLLAYDQLA